MHNYEEFLASKFKFSRALGFEIPADEPHAILKPHQRDLVRWAVHKGRAAIFAAFGLGKTIIQIEVLRAISRRRAGRYLVIAPLGVRQEFIRDAAMIGVHFTFIRRSDEVTEDGFYLTNYESVRDGKLDVNLFTGISLDEASVLRSFGSKTYQEFLTLFSDIPFRFVATATPSPNRYKELIHYAGFLGVMDTGQARGPALRGSERPFLAARRPSSLYPRSDGICRKIAHCHRAIFVGIGYKFNDFIQAIHRIHRFLQTRKVIIDIIYTETERQILEVLKQKWAEDEELRRRMTVVIRKHGLSTAGLENELRRSIGVTRTVEIGEHFEVANNDCIDEVLRKPDNSVDLIHTSIPFGNHYEYSTSYNDFGHNDNNERFFEQMDFLTPGLLRILRPGRVAAIHVKDRIRFGNVTGYGMPTVDPFHCDCINHYRKHGFAYMGMITVVTDVVRENNQTYRLGWSEQCKDGTKMGVGSPEYILLFRKLPSDTSRAYADVRVEKSKDDYTRARWQVDAHAFWRSSGDRFLTPEELEHMGPSEIGRAYQKHSLESVYDHEQHIALGEALDKRGALPATFMTLAPASHHPDVWHDVNRMLTLNGEQTMGGLVNHICPLQFDIVDRIIRRYTNKGEIVFDPFAGLMTVPYRAIKLGRRGHGAELNSEYFRDGLRYLRAAEREAGAPSLFDFIPPTAPAEAEAI